MVSLRGPCKHAFWLFGIPDSSSHSERRGMRRWCPVVGVIMSNNETNAASIIQSLGVTIGCANACERAVAIAGGVALLTALFVHTARCATPA